MLLFLFIGLINSTIFFRTIGTHDIGSSGAGVVGERSTLRAALLK
jgi:hypothetical protein